MSAATSGAARERRRPAAVIVTVRGTRTLPAGYSLPILELEAYTHLARDDIQAAIGYTASRSSPGY